MSSFLWGVFVFLLYAMRRVDCRRCGGPVESFQGFFTAMGQEVISKICFVCSNMNKALDKVRAEETGRMKREASTRSSRNPAGCCSNAV